MRDVCLPVLAGLALLLLASCGGDPIGTECEFRGSGFQASSNCRFKCLVTRQIECPDGVLIRPAVCSGILGCTPGSCPDRQVCYHLQDAFEEESFCVPRDVCGVFADAALRAWELETGDSAVALREQRSHQPPRKPTVPTAN